VSLQRPALEHAEIFGEQTPHRLHDEALDFIRGSCDAVDQRAVDQRDLPGRLRREPAMMFGERRLDVRAGEEGEHVVPVGQLGE
jgi:hypothetical protein